MNPTTTSSHNLKSTDFTHTTDIQGFISSPTTSAPVSMCLPRLQSYSTVDSRFHDTSVSSFTPLSSVNAAGFPGYFDSASISSFNSHSGFHSHQAVQPTYTSLVTETDLYGRRQPQQQQQLPYITSCDPSSMQCFVVNRNNKLPDLQCSGGTDISYLPPHMVGLSSSPHTSLISPAYSPSSVTTQGSGGKRISMDGENKSGGLKSKSKKESHNRIERRRRDYINSQIARLSGLLPADMYRDVDGRRNKGTVLRLSVNYILQLRQAVAHAASLRQETAMARQLIPLLLNHIQALDDVVKEIELSAGKPLGGDVNATGLFMESVDPPEASFEGALDAWRTAMTKNVSRAASSGAVGSNGAESSHDINLGTSNPPMLEDSQVTFIRRPPLNTSMASGNVESSYLPNATFTRGHVCKLEDDDEGCYGGSMSEDRLEGDIHAEPRRGFRSSVSDGTTDTFDSCNRNTNNNSSSNFEASIMQLGTADSSGGDCGDLMQVDCQNH